MVTPIHDLYTLRDLEWVKRHADHLRIRYLAIFARFRESLRYVDLDPRNGSTFSYEYASILRDSGSAFGAFCEELVLSRPDSKPRPSRPTVGDFYRLLISYDTDLPFSFTDVPQLGHAGRLQPFLRWTANQSPSWWEAHNKAKHTNNAYLGCLGYATNAVAALNVLLCKLLNEHPGDEFFHGCGTRWTPGDKGTEHISRLFGPDQLPPIPN